MNESIDPTGCENEPITIPGSIQSHGVLLVLSGRPLTVTQISDNSVPFFGVASAEILGRSMADWIDADSIRVLDKVAGWEDPSEVNPLPIVLRAKPDEVFDGIIHRVDSGLVLELERGQPGVATSHVRGVLSSIQNSLSEIDVCRIAAEKTRLLTGFDRVIVYRFASDWSGEVVAEARADRVISYFGTHFPASDIPKQARELYTRKLLGVIPDVSYTPVPLLALEQGPPLDMSLCVLRSVSPIHLEYLRNMEVVATLTISLVISGKLWGIIACHHSKPWFGPYALRQDCQLLGQVTAAVIGVRAGADTQAYRVKRTELLALYLQGIAGGNHLAKRLTQETPNLLDFVESSGAAVFFEETWTTVGEVPDSKGLNELLDWLVAYTAEALFVTHTLPQLFPAALHWKGQASGLLSVQILPENRCYILWFRPEFIQTVTWAGDPAKSVIVEKGRLKLGPRKSFNSWKETVRLQSRPWTVAEIESAAELRNTLSGAFISQIERARMAEIQRQASQEKLAKEVEIHSLNETLERRVKERTAQLEAANKELEAFSYSISHDLRAPLRAVNGFAGIVLEDFSSQLPEEGRLYLERIREGGKRMGELIDDLLKFSRLSRQPVHRQTVNTQQLVQNVLEELKPQQNGREIELRLTKLPACEADPRLLTQVWVNLLSNAIKYTRHRHPAIVEIGGSNIGNENVYFVRDNGTGFDMQYVNKLFGVFQRLHRADQFEGTGVGLAIVQRIVHRHGGRVWAEAALDHGATFSFTLEPKNKL